MPDDDEFLYLLSEQRRELMAAETLDSDLDLAFHLQLEEALAASVALQPSTSSSTSSNSISDSRLASKKDGVSNFAVLQFDEIARSEQEAEDSEAREAEMRSYQIDFARLIRRISEDDWSEIGDNDEQPFGFVERCSNSKGVAEKDGVFMLYTQGIVSEESVRGEKTVLAGIGVAICDPRGNLILEVRKPLVGNGMSKNGAQAKALIEGLNAALGLGLKRITIYFDYYPLYQFVSLFSSSWIWSVSWGSLCLGILISGIVFINVGDERLGSLQDVKTTMLCCVYYLIQDSISLFLCSFLWTLWLALLWVWWRTITRES